MPDIIDSFTGQYRFLSNFFPAQIRMRGMLYPTVEHAYQAAKTTDERERRVVRTAPTPAGAKRAGKRVTLRPDWDDVRVPLMVACVRMKFTDPALAAKLLATGEATLVERNHWGDTFWGVCDGEGRNQLGEILMTVREELRTASAQPVGFSRVFRTGKQFLWREGDGEDARWFVRLVNRTNDTTVEIPFDRVQAWVVALAPTITMTGV